MVNILLSFSAAAVCSLAGILLLRIAFQTVNETDDAEKTTLPLPSFRLTAAAMAAVNLVLAFFLPGFYGLGWADLLRTLLMCAILWACAWSDARAYLIPNRVLAVGSVMAAAVLLLELAAAPTQAFYLLVQTAVSVVALLLAGLCLGMELVWPALFFSFVVVFCVCVVLLITRRAKRTDSIPFAPFLLAGTVLAAFLTGI